MLREHVNIRSFFVLYCTVQYCMYCTYLRYCTVLYCTVPYRTVLYCTVLYQYCIVLYFTVLYCTTRYIILYYTGTTLKMVRSASICRKLHYYEIAFFHASNRYFYKVCFRHVSCEFDRELLTLTFAGCVIRQARLFYISFMIWFW